MTPCEQTDNIKHIQEDLSNHKTWRKETTSQLQNIEVGIATLNERLKSSDKTNATALETKLSKFDDHVKDGNSFRVGLILTALALAGSIFIGIIEIGRMEQKLDISYRHSMKITEGDAP